MGIDIFTSVLGIVGVVILYYSTILKVHRVRSLIAGWLIILIDITAIYLNPSPKSVWIGILSLYYIFAILVFGIYGSGWRLG